MRCASSVGGDRRRRRRRIGEKARRAAAKAAAAEASPRPSSIIHGEWWISSAVKGYARTVRDAAMVRDDLALNRGVRRRQAVASWRGVVGRDARVAVADATRDVPLIDDSVDAVISVFAPRSPSELARVVRAGGRVCIARPGEDHMRELRELNGDGVTVLGVEPGKSDRVDASMLSNGFEIVHRREIHGTLTLSERALICSTWVSGHLAKARLRGERRAARRDEIVRGGGISAVSRRMNR